MTEKNNVFVYFKGCKKQSEQIINYLESLGGKNRFNYDADDCDALYYVDAEGDICYVFECAPSAQWIIDHYTEMSVTDEQVVKCLGNRDLNNRRYEIAKAALPGLIGRENCHPVDAAAQAVAYADELLDTLNQTQL